MEKEKSTKNSTAPSYGERLTAGMLTAMEEANKEGDTAEFRELREIGEGEQQQPEK